MVEEGPRVPPQVQEGPPASQVQDRPLDMPQGAPEALQAPDPALAQVRKRTLMDMSKSMRLDRVVGLHPVVSVLKW